jgi:arylsulfatase A-like enzyme
MPTDTTPPLARLGATVSGGLFGGSLVGILEAAHVLGSMRPSEYQALVYATVLYGLTGAAAGIGLGAVLALPPARRLPRWATWAAGFHAVVVSLGFVILRYVLNKSVYAEQGVPTRTSLAVLGGLVVASLVGALLARVLLTHTPLRVLPGARATVVAWGALVALAGLFSAAPAPGASPAAPVLPPPVAGAPARPDVVLLLVDTLRADALGVHGAPADATPRLDAFAKDAVVFDQHVTSAAWTRASTASLLTSLSPSSHACERKDSALPDMVVTLAEVLQEGGYATGGLPNNANVTGALGFGQGFAWFPYTPQYPLAASESTYALSLYNVLRRVRMRLDSRKRIEDYYTPAETQFARAQRFLDAARGRPAFLFVHLMEPHDPYFVHPWNGSAVGRAEFPDPDPSRLDELRGLYAGEVHHVDAAIGAFLDGLKAAGRYDDTIIVITSDHGEEFREHGGWWHGSTLYDEQVHTPLLVKLPRSARAGTRVPWQVRQIDVAPTVTDVAGLAPHASWQGAALFDDNFDADLAKLRAPAVEADDPASTEAAAAFVAPTWANHPASREALSEQDFEGYDLQALRSDGHKLIQALRTPRGNPRNLPAAAAYDLLADPAEARDLAGTGASWESALAARLETLVQQRRESRVAERDATLSEAERARLEALGYMQGAPGAAPGAEGDIPLRNASPDGR